MVRSIDYTDTSTSAITRAGGVGMRSYITANGVRSTFDDLKVTSSSPGLLWYDDYYDGQAPKMQSYDTGVSQSVTGRKYQFGGIGNGERALGLIEFGAETSQAAWENVEASALMRLNTNISDGGYIATGLILRETGVTNATSTGAAYHYRLARSETGTDDFRAQLYRTNGGAFSLLDWVSLTNADVPESQNIFLKASTVTEAGGVRIVGLASLSPDFTDPFGWINFLDTSANRILGPGSVGFRVYGAGGITNGAVNYDNFTVRAIPEPAALLVWSLLAGLGIGLGWRRRRK